MGKLAVFGAANLSGKVTISGSKNAALPILISTVLNKNNITITNVPDLTDIVTAIRLLNNLGMRAEFSNNEVRIQGTNDLRHIAPYELITKMRASFFIAGAIVARVGMAKIPYPGGCLIGSRPVNIHLRGLESFGMETSVEHGFVILKTKDKLKPAHFKLDFPSVGATENLMMTATLVEGTTILKNVAKEPEIAALADFLNKSGAKIKGAGTSTIEIQGVSDLHSVEHKIIPDRIETATFAILALITKSDLVLESIDKNHIPDLINVMTKIGVCFEFKNEDELIIYGSKQEHIKSINIKTGPYPNFSTDIQPLLMTFLSTISGKSTITETIFENRFMHVMELNRMGANIDIQGNKAVIIGRKEKLSSADVKAKDLRGGAALILASLAAEGKSIITGIHHIERGYENIVKKLNKIGANIEHY
jgi:UDP-N-acetylglucosamine 1-carboxyvinyltransferase